MLAQPFLHRVQLDATIFLRENNVEAFHGVLSRRLTSKYTEQSSILISAKAACKMKVDRLSLAFSAVLEPGQKIHFPLPKKKPSEPRK
jgi:hypothetical protein